MAKILRNWFSQFSHYTKLWSQGSSYNNRKDDSASYQVRAVRWIEEMLLELLANHYKHVCQLPLPINDASKVPENIVEPSSFGLATVWASSARFDHDRCCIILSHVNYCSIGIIIQNLFIYSLIYKQALHGTILNEINKEWNRKRSVKCQVDNEYNFEFGLIGYFHKILLPNTNDVVKKSV